MHIIIYIERWASKIRTNFINSMWTNLKTAQHFEILTVLNMMYTYVDCINLEGYLTVLPFSCCSVCPVLGNSSLFITIHNGNMGSWWIWNFQQGYLLKAIARENLTRYCREVIFYFDAAEKIWKEHLESAFTIQLTKMTIINFHIIYYIKIIRTKN